MRQQKQKEDEEKEKQKQKEKEKEKFLEDAQATQCLLLDLAMFAERHLWEAMHNAAIDAFCEGRGEFVP